MLTINCQFCKNGGRLILFTDEDRRINIEAFGANEIVKPLGMQFGNDLPMVACALFSINGFPSNFYNRAGSLRVSG